MVIKADFSDGDNLRVMETVLDEGAARGKVTDFIGMEAERAEEEVVRIGEGLDAGETFLRGSDVDDMADAGGL